MIAIDGLVYPGIPSGPKPSEWVDLLGRRMPTYAAQPYQQLASAYLAAGRERDARRLLIAQHDDLLHRGEVRGLWLMQHRLLRLTIGYGYQSWRALGGLALTAFVAICFVTCICAPVGSLNQVSAHATVKGCSVVEQVGLALNLAIPLVGPASSQQCTLVSTRTGNEWTIAVGWLIQALGWAFATLFVAGYTGLVRKS
jgi:hypothetical protein